VQSPDFKSIDYDYLVGSGGPVGSGLAAAITIAATSTIAQDWLNLRVDRGLSFFDQRHLLNAFVQDS